MAPMQREIEDERKSKLPYLPHLTGVGSLGGCWGSPAGLTMSGVGIDTAFGTRFHRESPGIVDIHLPSLSAEILKTFIATQRSEALSSSPGLRERELEWRRTHVETLRQFENEWVILEGAKIIAHGFDPVQVIREAKNENIQNPYIFFVEPESENLVRFGL